MDIRLKRAYEPASPKHKQCSSALVPKDLVEGGA
jgi:hypothetical protein